MLHSHFRKEGRRKKCESQETCQEVLIKILNVFGGKTSQLMRRFQLFIFGLLFICFSAQEKVIDTVYLLDKQLNNSKKDFYIQKLNQSEILENATSLSELLRTQSSLNIKENGRGAVSSPSFRGTTAQQTAFIWNGININSIFLGQGDLNNLNFLDADNIAIKSGGGSLAYGSSAIGGSVHFNNELRFNEGFKTLLFSEYGSFKTSNNLLRVGFSTGKAAVKINVTHNESENQYEVPAKNYINRNGQYSNNSYSLGAAYKFNDAHQLIFQNYFSNNHQHFPVFFENATRTKYKTSEIRNLLTYKYENSKVKNQASFAYLEEEFSYFNDIKKPRYSGGRGETYLAKNDFTQIVNPSFKYNFIAEYKFLKGAGYNSGINRPERQSFSLAAFADYLVTKNIRVRGGLRKDFIENTNSAWLYSFSSRINLNDFYNFSLNYSKNFRIPTFNDLYYQPGGNLNLLPEISNQVELRNQVKLYGFVFTVIPYYNKVKNLIQYLPTSSGIFAPVNTNSVEIFGIESAVNYKKNFGAHFFEAALSYAYTHSENTETKTQLVYVPFYKFSGDVNYHYKNFGFSLQSILNGKSYTTPDQSEKNVLKSYLILNLGANYEFFKHYRIGFKVNNLTNEIYETTDFYPLPQRNYSINLLLKF